MICECGHSIGEHGENICLDSSCQCGKGKKDVAIAALRARLAEAEDLLRRIEECNDKCPLCSCEPFDHEPDCELSAFLANR